MSYWNVRAVHRPPCLTVKQECVHKGKLTRVVTVVNNAVTILKNQTHLNSEHYVLKRLVHRSSNQMRHDKLLQKMKQFEKCFNRYRQEDLLDLFLELQKILPSEKDAKQARSVYVPTRAVVEHVLVRLQRAAALLAQQDAYIIQAFIYSHQELKWGHFIPNLVIYVCLLSRVWVLCRMLLKHIYGWYDALHEFLGLIPEFGVPWLPAGETLPTQLAPWLDGLGLKPPELGHDRTPAKVRKLDTLLGKFAPDDDTVTANKAGRSNGLSSAKSLADYMTESPLMGFVPSDDVGSPIARRSSQAHISQGLNPGKKPKVGKKRKVENDGNSQEQEGPAKRKKQRINLADAKSVATDASEFKMKRHKEAKNTPRSRNKPTKRNKGQNTRSASPPGGSPSFGVAIDKLTLSNKSTKISTSSPQSESVNLATKKQASQKLEQSPILQKRKKKQAEIQSSDQAGSIPVKKTKDKMKKIKQKKNKKIDSSEELTVEEQNNNEKLKIKKKTKGNKMIQQRILQEHAEENYSPGKNKNKRAQNRNSPQQKEKAEGVVDFTELKNRITNGPQKARALLKSVRSVKRELKLRNVKGFSRLKICIKDLLQLGRPTSKDWTPKKKENTKKVKREILSRLEAIQRNYQS